MAYTQTDLAAINAALLRGEKSVQFADRSVTYRDIAEIIQVRDIIIAELAPATVRRRQYLGVSSKGLS